MNPASASLLAMLRHTLAVMGLREHDQPLAPTVSCGPETPRTAAGGTLRSLAWCGEIVAGNADEVWRMTVEHVEVFAASRATLIVIDLSRLRFIDSSGAALMLRLKRWSQVLRVEILFARPPPHVRNVLQLTRIEQLLLEGGQ